MCICKYKCTFIQNTHVYFQNHMCILKPTCLFHILLVRSLMHRHDSDSRTASNIENSLTTPGFVMTTLYKRAPRSLWSMLSPSNNNLFWNEVQTTSRTFLCTSCRCRAGSFSDRVHWTERHYLLMRVRLLMWVQTRFRPWQLGPNGPTHRLATKVNTYLMWNNRHFSEK